MALPDAPGILFRREDPSIPSPPRQSTSILLAQGVTKRGPVGTPTLITSFSEFEAKYGSWTVDGFLPNAIAGAYDNAEDEGMQIWVSRVVHYTDITAPASKTSAAASLAVNIQTGAGGGATSGTHTGSQTGPFEMSDGDTLRVKIDGNAAVVATFNGAAASEETANVDTYDFSAGGETLTVKINQGSVQTITFQPSNFDTPAAGTAEEVAAVINAKVTGASATVTSGGTKVTITSDREGTGSYVEITGGTSNTELGFPTAEIQGTGNVVDIAAVTITEVVTVVDAVLDVASPAATASASAGRLKLTSDQTGASSSIQVEAASELDTVLGLDNAVHIGSASGAQDTLSVDAKYDGSYSNVLSIEILPASNEEKLATRVINEYFNLRVLDGGVVREVFVNLTMDSTNPRYVETVVNDPNTGSEYIQVADEDATGTALTRRPLDLENRPSPDTDNPYGPLTGGDDGLVGMLSSDFTGNESAGTGLYAFDSVANAQLLISPDWVTESVAEAMITYCEVDRKGKCFAILDVPEGKTTSPTTGGVGGYVVDGNLLNRSELAAIYATRFKVRNPSPAVYGTAATVTVPYSGHVAGIYARHDAHVAAGVWKPPAGLDDGAGVIRGIVGLENEDVLNEKKVKLFFPLLVNPIATGDGLPFFLDGARTLRETGSFPTIGESRGVLFFVSTAERLLIFTRNTGHDERLRRRANEALDRFLGGEMNKGAFASPSKSSAYYVDTSEKLNPPSLVRDRKMNIRVGLATLSPNEFTIVSITQFTG
ncbi:MAG TPA: hypothetical protein VMY39_08710 [Planctomycetota bacterium]|nr:hypothetical protein [Planctomycetota bacterium]